MSTKKYVLGGKEFTTPAPVARQSKWILALTRDVFRDGSISEADLIGVLSQWISRLSAILVVPVGMTQSAKTEGGIAEVERQEEWLDTHATLEEMGEVAGDFFTSGQLTRIMTGLMRPMRGVSTLTTSTKSWPPSPTETPSEPNGSGRTFASASPAPSSNGAGSVDSPSEPSLDSAASRSPG